MLHVIATINRLRNESNVTPIHCNSSRLESLLVIYEFNVGKMDVQYNNLIMVEINIKQFHSFKRDRKSLDFSQYFLKILIFKQVI